MRCLRLATALALCLGTMNCESDDPVADGGGTDAATDGGPGTDAGEPPLEPDHVCPGSEGCEESTDTVLYAGAAAIEVTPNLERDYDSYDDANGNAEYEPEDEDIVRDVDGDGELDPIWIAGFGNGRAALGIMNPQWARAIALRTGNTTVAFVVIDSVGWFIDDADEIRAAVADMDVDVDYVVVAATHVHEAGDTIGLWGATIGQPGVVDTYQAQVTAGAAQAVADAVEGLTPAHVEYASVRLTDAIPDGNVLHLVGDNRHPNILDDEIRIMRFIDAEMPATADDPGSGRTIATWINFGAHPEYQGSNNSLLSSDFPHWLRETVEDGLTTGPSDAPIAGVGGIAVYWNAAIGVQIGPNHVDIRSWTDEPLSDDGEPGARAVGEQLGYYALKAIRGDYETSPPEIETTAAISFRTDRFRVHVENTTYHLAGKLGVFTRGLYDYDENRPISPRNLPRVETEIAVINVGNATMLSLPGELDPAEWLGGFEAPCPYTPGGCENMLYDTENQPDLSMAPTGPFLRDMLLAARPDDSPATQVWPLGLTNDFLGYFVLDFDFEIGRGGYLTEAEGQHYEETNSLGPNGWPHIRYKMHELIEWTE